MCNINVKRGPYKTNEAILESINVSHTLKDLLKLYMMKKHLIFRQVQIKTWALIHQQIWSMKFLEYSIKKYQQSC